MHILRFSLRSNLQGYTQCTRVHYKRLCYPQSAKSGVSQPDACTILTSSPHLASLLLFASVGVESAKTGLTKQYVFKGHYRGGALWPLFTLQPSLNRMDYLRHLGPILTHPGPNTHKYTHPHTLVHVLQVALKSASEITRPPINSSLVLKMTSVE